MSTWPHAKRDPSAETLTERLARSRDLAGPHHAGDTFGQGGWQHHAIESEQPPPPSAWLTLIPFLVLLIVAVAVTLALLMVAGGQS